MNYFEKAKAQKRIKDQLRDRGMRAIDHNNKYELMLVMDELKVHGFYWEMSQLTFYKNKDKKHEAFEPGQNAIMDEAQNDYQGNYTEAWN